MDRDEQLFYEKLLKLAKANEVKTQVKVDEKIRKFNQSKQKARSETTRTQYFR